LWHFHSRPHFPLHICYHLCIYWLAYGLFSSLQWKFLEVSSSISLLHNYILKVEANTWSKVHNSVNETKIIETRPCHFIKVN
jgi:hypothetical protein